MSKELEALNILRDNHIQFTREKYGKLDEQKLQNIINRKSARWDILEEALNELEDAKHNYKALEEFYNNAVAYSTKIQKELNELKKRNEPMKPLLKDMGFEHYDIYCPSCKEYIGFRNSVRHSLTLKYCPDCGQALERIDEGE
mgnify:CR=1 FL=1